MLFLLMSVVAAYSFELALPQCISLTVRAPNLTKRLFEVKYSAHVRML